MANSRRLSSADGDASAIPASFTPGPAGYNDASDPDSLVCRMGDTQGPLGAASDHGDPHGSSRGKAVVDIPILAVDSDQLHRFLRSVAITKAQDRHLQMKWQPYNDSAVINAIYTVLFWAQKPGVMDANIGDPKQVQKEADGDTDELLNQFAAKVSGGPPALKDFLETQARTRATCLARTQAKFAEVNTINAEVRAETARGVVALARIKLGADLLLQGLGMISGKTIGTRRLQVAVGLGYDVITGLVESWDKTPSAKVIAVSKPVGREVGKHVSEKIAETAEAKILEGEGFVQRSERLGKLIEEYEKDLIGKGSGKAAKLRTRIRLRSGEMATAERAAQRSAQSAAVRKALGKLKFVFIADAIYDNWREYREALEAVEGDLPDTSE
jgi:hypothetical protein